MNIGIFGGRFDPIHRGHISLAAAAAERYGLGRVLFVPVNAPPHKDKQTITEFVHRYAMVTLATAEEKRFVPSLLEGPEEGAALRAAGQPGAPPPQHAKNARDGAPGAVPTRAGRAGAPVAPPNYSIDTVRRVKASLKKVDRLFFLIGIDAFHDIAKWHEARALLGECEFVVASRPGYSLRDVAEALPEELRPPAAVTKPFHKQPASGDLVLPGVTLHLLEGVHQNVSATAIRAAAARGKPLARWLDARVAGYIKKVGLYR